MSRKTDQSAVRPLSDVPIRRSPPRRPAQVLSIALLVLGAAAGYLLGLTGDAGAGAAPATTTSSTAPPVGAGSAGLTIAEYEWTRQVPPRQDPNLWAVHTAIAHDGYIYLLIVDDIRNRISRALWRSADGANWQEVSLDLGPDAVATDLDVYRGNLLVSGWHGDRPAVWHSPGIGVLGGTTWSMIPLPAEPVPLGEVARVFSAVNTAVNDADEIAVVATMQLAIEPSLVAGSSHTAQRPQIAVTESTIWTRTTGDDGFEDIRTLEVPRGLAVNPVAGAVGTDVVELQAWSSWVSRDGRSFEVIEAKPDFHAAPTVYGFNDGFVASIAESGNRAFSLAVSNDGSAWEPASPSPPPECGDERPVVVGAGRMLLVSEHFDYACTSINGRQWQVRPTPETAISSGGFLLLAGNEHQFLGIALNATEWAAVESMDGLNWQQIDYPSEVAGGTAHLVGERIVSVKRSGGRGSPDPWTAWVGERLDG